MTIVLGLFFALKSILYDVVFCAMPLCMMICLFILKRGVLKSSTPKEMDVPAPKGSFNLLLALTIVSLSVGLLTQITKPYQSGAWLLGAVLSATIIVAVVTRASSAPISFKNVLTLAAAMTCVCIAAALAFPAGEFLLSLMANITSWLMYPVAIVFANGVSRRFPAVACPVCLSFACLMGGLSAAKFSEFVLAAPSTEMRLVIAALLLVLALLVLVFGPRQSQGGLVRPEPVDDGVEEYCAALAKLRNLTPREQQITVLLFRGHSCGRIADKLSVSQNTVRAHRRAIYQKLEIHSHEELLDLFSVDDESRDDLILH